jgi:hypothetical protein
MWGKCVGTEFAGASDHLPPRRPHSFIDGQRGGRRVVRMVGHVSLEPSAPHRRPTDGQDCTCLTLTNRYGLRVVFTLRLINLDKLIDFDVVKYLSRAAGGPTDLHRLNLPGAAKPYLLPQRRGAERSAAGHFTVAQRLLPIRAGQSQFDLSADDEGSEKAKPDSPK